jgi:LysM repeat protein
MKTTIFRSSWQVMVIAGAALAPAVLSAQSTPPARTHQVRAGETLARIAADSLGDASRWREILALNPTLSPNTMRVGMRIQLPPAGARQAGTRQPADAPTTPPLSSTPLAPMVPAQGEPTQRTIFYGFQVAGGFTATDSSRRLAAADSAIPARVFESMSAPFVTDSFAFGRAGRCVGLADEGANAVRGVLLSGTLSVLVGGNTGAEAGSRWMLVRRGPAVPGLGVIGTPTGIVRLTSAGTAMSPARAEVVAQFDAMSCADAVFPMPYLPPPSRARAAAVSDGARGRVAWVEGDVLLPTLQHAMVVDIGTQAGVKAGDRVTVYAEDGTIAAKANVVRADTRTSTVRVVSQSSASLTSGLVVRVTEKLP